MFKATGGRTAVRSDKKVEERRRSGGGKKNKLSRARKGVWCLLVLDAVPSKEFRLTC